MNRREMISTTALGAVGFAVGTGFAAPKGCSVKNLSSYVQMIAGGFTEIKVLLPDLGLSQSIIAQAAELIDKGVKIARDFDAAYKAGKFNDAASLFTNLGSTLTQVINTLGVSTENRAVKVALAAIGIARVAVAILLNKQADDQPAVAVEVAKAGRKRGTSAAKAVTDIERLAATDLDRLLAAIPQ